MRTLPNLTAGIATLPPLQSRYMSRIPFTLACIGHTASGKTWLGMGITKRLLVEGTITKLYVLCPTALSATNAVYRGIIKLERDLVEQDIDKAFEFLKRVQADCEAEADKYYVDLEYVCAYNAFRKGEHVTHQMETLLERRNYRPVTPKRPSGLLILDDCSHSPLYSTSRKNPLTNLVLRARHCAHGLGLSILLMCQSYRTGVPRAMRLNTTHFALFGTQNTKEIEAMAEECSSMIGFERFCQLFRLYTAQPHGYLWCDLITKQVKDSF